eukprot:TRINITY_DN80389_c0_g1_i1.p1 TRINITY_DN80389_c0_g1~~TRINITY_DN80389_c0_g1_i1.p1  ORF type:complete len:358 (-),score=55.62 TRINITY_DN80389_c0_g1_i1:19-1092(-)
MPGKHYFLNGKLAENAAVNPVGVETGKEATIQEATDAIKSILSNTGGSCIRIFVAGAVSHVGKTSVCLGILAALRKAGLKSQELAYIKPATQCEAPDLLSKWCASEGIENVSGENAPLVFYSGFTRSFLAGEQGTSESWLDKIAARVDSLSQGRRVVIVDGVGFPAVGSIVGVDNADVAKASRAPVLLVCKSGVGAAVDSFSLTSSYFLAKGVPVLGGVFNLGDLEGFNSWDKCATNISLWFSRKATRREKYYGVVPLAKELDGLRERIGGTGHEVQEQMAVLNARHFATHADLPGLLADAAADPWNRQGSAVVDTRPTKIAKTSGDSAALAPTSFQPRSRETVLAEARKKGATGGG